MLLYRYLVYLFSINVIKTRFIHTNLNVLVRVTHHCLLQRLFIDVNTPMFIHPCLLQQYVSMYVYNTIKSIFYPDPVIQKVPVVHTVMRKVPVPVHKPVPYPVERKVPYPVHVPG